ncbi:MAG TPA: thioredoxin family protein [Anaerolineae bacterium]
MKIDLLYFEGCPSWETGKANLETALQAEGLTWPVEMVEVVDDGDAERHKFLGSPSFQVDGEDLWPLPRQDYDMSCRLYVTPEGRRGWPTVEMFREKLQRLAGK